MTEGFCTGDRIASIMVDGTTTHVRLGILFSGGKDSCFALYRATRLGYDIGCLIALESENEASYMFHTPAIASVVQQAEVLGIPLLLRRTAGEKERELVDLERAIRDAMAQYGIDGIVTGAVGSVYQASRVQRICHRLRIGCYNPLWQMDQLALLAALVANGFTIVLSGVFAYPLDERWVGRAIDDAFVADMEELEALYRINPAGEGGEYETLVLDCPLFSRPLRIVERDITGRRHSFRMAVRLAVGSEGERTQNTEEARS